jgi:hypothetical protein
MGIYIVEIGIVLVSVRESRVDILESAAENGLHSFLRLGWQKMRWFGPVTRDADAKRENRLGRVQCIFGGRCVRHGHAEPLLIKIA